MKHLSLLLMALALSAVSMAACAPPVPPATSSPGSQPTTAAIANPASEYCINQSGKLDIRKTDAGEVGVCVFDDGSECEEWALMRGECKPGQPPAVGMPNPASENCIKQGGKLDIRNTDAGEVGVCVFDDGSECEEWALMRGECQPGQAPVAAPAETPATATTGRVPLKDAVATMDPQDVWQNFYDLTQIPRPSHHEEKVRDYLVQFGKDLGLETIVDDAGNVLIRKPAAKGMENREGVILQAHMDMVPQKTSESTHDFLTDPIDAYVDGDWVVADGTTLGADDGIGMAIAMAVLQSQTPLGPIEVLFTVNEEDGMSGALGLQAGLLQGKILINLDSETEGEFTIGSAGGEYANVTATYPEVEIPDGVAAYQVSVAGLQGGHSGVDVNLGRGHATKLLVRFLTEAAAQNGVRLAQIAGGDAANAITREASALVVVPNDQVDAFLKHVQEFESIVKAELAAVEPDLNVQAVPADLPVKVMDETAQRMLVDALYATPQGVMRMSDAVPGLVETSTNIGIVKGEDGTLEVTCYLRSSVDTELDDLGQMIASVWDLAGIDVAFSGRYSGWNPNPNSPILLLMQDVYQELYGQEAEVVALHAGLECGTISAKYPGIDAISIGPTLEDVHTPNERLEVATVQKLVDLLQETLERVPAK